MTLSYFKRDKDNVVFQNLTLLYCYVLDLTLFLNNEIIKTF